MRQSLMTFFNAPITNKMPGNVCNLQSLHAYIVNDTLLAEKTTRVRAALTDSKQFRQLKQRILPYVTPAGVFTYCREQSLLVPSGNFVIDLDHLASAAEARDLRDRLFNDDFLLPDLAFVSPSGTGVKLFVPYRLYVDKTVKDSFHLAMHTAWEYLRFKYELQIDKSNADLCRACFICHDGEAKLR